MKTDILGVKFDNYSVSEAAEIAVDSCVNNKKCFIVTPNPEIVDVATKNETFRNILNSADIVTPDGVGIVYASKLLKGNIKERAAGFDIVCKIIEVLAQKGKSLYILGGKPSVAETAAQNLKAKYPNIVIAGFHDGYFSDEKPIINDINLASPDMLLVCLGAPKQEKFIFDNKDLLNAHIMVGAGGSVDVLAGKTKRAPDIFIKLGLEWFYRLLKEPSRIGRMAKLPVFLLKVMFRKDK